MKKALRTVFITLVVIVLALSMVACGNSNLNFGKELVKTDDMISILTELVAGTADVGIMDSIMAGYYMSQDTNYSDKLMIIDSLVLAEEKYGIAARKEGASTIYQINTALKALVADGTVETIAKEYGLEKEVIIDKDADIGAKPTDTDWDYIKEKGKLIVGYTVFAPIAYTNDKNEFVGFDIDLAKAVGTYLGITVEFNEIIWENKEIALQAKSIDLVWNGMTITPEREASMSISIPYLANKQVAIIRKADKDVYTDTASMKKAVIAAEGGSAGQDVVEKAAE